MFTHFSNHSFPTLQMDGRGVSGRPQAMPTFTLRSRRSIINNFRNSMSFSVSGPPVREYPRVALPKSSHEFRREARQSSRWNPKRLSSRSVIGPPQAKKREAVELGVCMIDEGWALLVHPKSELDLPSTIGIPITGSTTSSLHARNLGYNSDALMALEGKRPAAPPTGASMSTSSLPYHPYRQPNRNGTVTSLDERQHSSVPPSAFQKINGAKVRPQSVVSAPHPPVSCLRRQSMPPMLEPQPASSAKSTSIKFAECDEVPEVPDAKRHATVASLNETLRLRKTLSQLQQRHSELFEAASGARTEIHRLYAKLEHSQEVMEHLIDWGLAMQTENEILREQIPGGQNGRVMLKTADELRALFDRNFGNGL